MAKHFKSWRSFWDFDQSVRKQRRFIHTDGVKEFLETVLETGHKRADTIPEGVLLWRSQLGTTWETRTQGDGEEEFEYEEEVAFSEDRMLPLPEGASEGRVNAKGIPCVYLADDKDTAMAEVRPWISASLSLGQFKVLKSTKVIDFSEDDGKHLLYMKEPGPEERDRAVWRAINRAFSRPVTPSDRHGDYVSTQILAELFRANGYEGIVFKSSCGSGHNVALFDLDRVKLLGAAPYEAKRVQFEFSQSGNAYSIREKKADAPAG